MKTRLLLSLLAVCLSFTASAQQIGNGTTVNITDFDQAIPSGMYSNSYFMPPLIVGGAYIAMSDFLISAKSNYYNLQLKVVSPDPRYLSVIPRTDKLYFRINSNSSTTTKSWVEVATCGHNTFTSNQIINGRIGIKTSSPSYDLDVAGTGRFTGNVFMNGKVGIKVSNPTYDLDVNGVIRAKEVRVETGWADFVFDKSYELPALSEVKAHIEEHKHLPGMPTAAEVKENGIGLSEATTLLLQKVEELTLYVIELKEENERQSAVIQSLINK